MIPFVITEYDNMLTVATKQCYFNQNCDQLRDLTVPFNLSYIDNDDMDEN